MSFFTTVIPAEGARELAEVGVDAILVSAHGGRQLDYVPAPVSWEIFWHVSPLRSKLPWKKSSA